MNDETVTWQAQGRRETGRVCDTAAPPGQGAALGFKDQGKDEAQDWQAAGQGDGKRVSRLGPRPGHREGTRQELIEAHITIVPRQSVLFMCVSLCARRGAISSVAHIKSPWPTSSTEHTGSMGHMARNLEPRQPMNCVCFLGKSKLTVGTWLCSLGEQTQPC